MAIRRLITSFFLANTLLLAVAAHGEQSMYRYRNAQGVLVVDFSIPPEFVAGGYDVLTMSGKLIDTVPPLTGNSDERREAIRLQALQEKEDAFILRSYSTLEDVERARKRKLLLVEREIASLEANLSDFARQKVQLREKAANYQASGQAAPQTTTGTLAQLDVHEENSRKLLAERRAQLKEINTQYDRYAQRLVTLRPSAANTAPAAAGGVSEETDPAQ